MNVQEIFSPTFDPARIGEIKTVLRLKGDKRAPSYKSIADDFGVHSDTVRRFHAALCAEDPSFPGREQGYTRQDMLMELQTRVSNGEPPTDLFKTITAGELEAMVAGITRMMFVDLGNTDKTKGLGSPTVLLKYIDLYRDMKGYNRAQGVESELDLERLETEDLTRIEQEANEHITSIREARERRTSKDFLKKYGSETIEIEAEEVGSVGEAQGG